MSAPSEYSCQYFDAAIEEIDSGLSHLENVHITAWVTLEAQLEKAKDFLENARQVNSDLREWGEVQEKRADEAEDLAESWEEKADDLKRYLEDAQKEIAELESQVKDLENNHE